MMAGLVVKCRCVWNDVECEADATQEDAMCDWCGVRRPEDLQGSPWLIAGTDGKYVGLAGGSVTPFNPQWGRCVPEGTGAASACWMERGDW